MTVFRLWAKPRWPVRAALAIGCFVLAACADAPRIDSRPVQVALLVPAGSGQPRDDALAADLENAARLAIADLGGVKIDLRVHATAGNARQAATAAARAINDGARIILGPVYSSSAASVGRVAAARRINVLAFSNNTDVARGNVFLLGNTFENTADRLVRYAIANGRSRIMIANGRSAEEEKGRDAIVAAIGRNGARLAGQVSFDLTQDGVLSAVPEIAETAEASGAQALFLTSGTAGALPILAQLVWESGVRPEAMQYIGLQRWDIPASARELPPLQGGWFAMPSPTLTAQFQSRYRAAYDTLPHPLSSLAYDGIAAIGALVGARTSRPLSITALTQRTGFAGVNGVFRLRMDGTNERGLAVAMIGENKVKVIDPAPRSLGRGGF